METDDKLKIVYIFIAMGIICVAIIVLQQGNTIDALKHDNRVLSDHLNQIIAQKEVNKSNTSIVSIQELYNLPNSSFTDYYRCRKRYYNESFNLSVHVDVHNSRDFYYQILDNIDTDYNSPVSGWDKVDIQDYFFRHERKMVNTGVTNAFGQPFIYKQEASVMDLNYFNVVSDKDIMNVTFIECGRINTTLD